MLFIKNKLLKQPQELWDQLVERKTVYRIDKATKMHIKSAQFSPNGCICALLMEKENSNEGLYLQLLDIRIISKQANNIDIYCLQCQYMNSVFSIDDRFFIATSQQPTLQQYLVFDLEEKRKSFIDHPIEQKVKETMMMADNKCRLYVLRNKDVKIYCLINGQLLFTIPDVKADKILYLNNEILLTINQNNSYIHFIPTKLKYKRQKLNLKGSDIFVHNNIFIITSSTSICLFYKNCKRMFRKISKSVVDKVEATYFDDDLIIILKKYVNKKLTIKKLCCINYRDFRLQYIGKDEQNQYTKSSSQGVLISKFKYELNFLFFT